MNKKKLYKHLFSELTVLPLEIKECVDTDNCSMGSPSRYSSCNGRIATKVLIVNPVGRISPGESESTKEIWKEKFSDALSVQPNMCIYSAGIFKEISFEEALGEESEHPNNSKESES